MAGPTHYHHCSDGGSACVYPGVCCCPVYLFDLLSKALKLLIANSVVLISLLFAVDIIQSIVTRKSSFRSISPIYHHGFIPNAVYDEEWSPGLRIVEKINPHGMRQTLSEKASPPLKLNQYKTAVIGDSFAEGIGVPYQNTIPSLIPSIYGPVANLGVRSHSPSLSEARLNYYKSNGLDVDYIIHLVDSSDIQDEYHYSFVEGFKPCSLNIICNPIQAIAENYLGRLVSFQLGTRMIWWINSGRWGNPYPFSFWGGRSDYYQKRDPYISSIPFYFDSGKRNLLQSLSRIRSGSESAKYIIVLYPPLSLILKGDLGNEAYQSLISAVKELFLDDVGVTICLPEMSLLSGRADEMYIRGDGHWNSKGHQVVAEYIMNNCMGSNVP